MPNHSNILGVGISAVNPPAVLDLMEHWIESRQSHYICVCAVHTVMECERDPRLRAMVNQASLAVPDGMPLVWLSRLAGQEHVSRVYGPDLMLSFCELAARKGYSNYLLGGAPGQPEILTRQLLTRFSGLVISGTHATPTRPLPAVENDLVIERINSANPDVVWVGMGTNAQERWMAENRHRLNAPVLVGVGAAFDMHSQKVRQAPALMQRAGLEWLFRLIQEPRRLWRRYVLGNPLFMAKVLAQRLGLRRYELPEAKAPASQAEQAICPGRFTLPAADIIPIQPMQDRSASREESTIR